jgi:hypothetical protein
MKPSAATESRQQRERALRFGADRISLWRLCADAACRRARACRGDVRACAGRMVDWLAAVEDERLARPDFAAIEAGIETPAELRAYRAWRQALPRAKAASGKAASHKRTVQAAE